MAFKILTQEEIDRLGTREREAYLQAYQEYRERVAFVENIERLENVQIPKPAIKRRPIGRIHAPGYQAAKFEEYKADAGAGVELLNATEHVKRAAEKSPVIHETQVTAKVPPVRTKAPGSVRMKESEPYVVGNINPVPIGSPAEMRFEDTEFKAEVAPQKMIDAPETKDVAINEYAVAGIPEDICVAADVLPAERFASVQEAAPYQVQVDGQPQVIAPSVETASFDPVQVSELPQLADWSEELPAESVKQAADELGKQEHKVGEIMQPAVDIPTVGEIRIDEYQMNGIPAEEIAATAAPTLSLDRFSNNQEKQEYKVLIENQPDITAPSVGEVVVGPVTVSGISEVHIATADIPAPVSLPDYEAAVPDVTVAAQGTVDVIVPEASKVTVSAVPVAEAAVVNIAESHFEVKGADSPAVNAPVIDYHGQEAPRAEVGSVVIPEIRKPEVAFAVNKVAVQAPVKVEAPKVETTIPQIQVQPAEAVSFTAAAPNVSIAASEVKSFEAPEYPIPEAVHFTEPEHRVEEVSVPTVSGPDVDVDAAMNTILAKLR